jgi:hypothetical protein
MTLTGRAKRVDDKAIIAQRLKRLPSVIVKLNRNANMAFSQMQDIGGCRAVVRSAAHVDRLVELYEEAVAKNPKAGAEFVKKYDYVSRPKSDGYRSVHLIYKYRTASRHRKPWVGLRIEIQIRSRLQHASATAVETVDIFTAQAIKTGGGIAPWRRFFLLMASAIAETERKPLCPGTPSDKRALRSELKIAAKGLNVVSVLKGWRDAMTRVLSATTNAGAFLMVVDPEADQLSITGFADKEQAKASDAYIATERGLSKTSGAQAVLVSAGSVQALRSAFPNYFADTTVFIEALERAMA